MTRAGLEHTVAPLGTALTAEQLALMWRMAEEPVLCFDGDKAGRKAAYRALDVALPELGPGKALRFAFLPEGQDPDDLLRSAGPEALKAALDRTIAFVDVLWARESEQMPADTPERRAGLEKRLRELAGQIRDEGVRRAYQDELRQRLQRLAGPASSGQRHFPGQRGAAGIYGRGAAPARPRFNEPPNLKTVPLAASPALARSAVVQGRALALPRREVALIMGAINHPSIPLLDPEFFAELEFEHPDLARLHQAISSCLAEDPMLQRDTLLDALAAAGLGLVLARVERALDPAENWALPEAELGHATAAWREAADLQARVSSIRRELDAAIVDYDDTEESYQRIRNLRERLLSAVNTDFAEG